MFGQLALHHLQRYRLRARGTNVLKEPTAPNGGQWGVAQDDYGKQWFVNAGGEQGPVNFQQPIVYGAFKIKDQFSSDYLEAWPLVGLADVQGGTAVFVPLTKRSIISPLPAAGKSSGATGSLLICEATCFTRSQSDGSFVARKLKCATG